MAAVPRMASAGTRRLAWFSFRGSLTGIMSRDCFANVRARWFPRGWPGPLFLALATFIGHAGSEGPRVAPPPAVQPASRQVMDDVGRWRRFADDLGEKFRLGGTLSMQALNEQLKSRDHAKARVRLARPERRVLEPEQVYERCSASVVAMGSVYKCPRCPHWHTGGTGTGWVLGDRGEVVSNYHVLAGVKETNVVAFGVMTLDGRCLPIREVLAADAARDVVIFRVEPEGLAPLPLSPREPVGRPVSVIAHPSGDLYTFTQGAVSRYALRAVEPGAAPLEWMCVTADFAVGSSGGPVLNRHGGVVGMVARTQTIHANPKGEAPSTQMVVKMTIPSEAILSLVEAGPRR